MVKLSATASKIERVDCDLVTGQGIGCEKHRIKPDRWGQPVKPAKKGSRRPFNPPFFINGDSNARSIQLCPRLDFDKHQRAEALGNKVDFAARGGKSPCKNAIPFKAQKGRRQPFGLKPIDMGGALA